MTGVKKPAMRVFLVLLYSFVPGGGFRPQGPWLSRSIVYAGELGCQ
jgi:hypothetical protein